MKIRGYRVELGEIETVLEQNELVSEAVVLAHTAKDGTKQLVSYIVPNWKAIKIRERKLYNARIANWQEVYENQYEKADIAGIQDPEFNTNCWNDSFEGGQIANEQMREWLDDFMQLVWTDKPENVLEIGCGTGLIYFQLAGKVNRYIGADFSSASIDYIQSVIAKGKRSYGETSLLVCPAHEIAIHEDEMIDTIILNSVVQYFPGEDYLNEVIAKCISVLGGKGRIVIGDVRDNRLLHIFKSRVLLHKLPDSLTIQEFK